MNKETSYDLIAYQSYPRSETHPDRYAVLASLLGMSPAPVDRCRVLELGCGTGGNLLHLAMTLPESQFLGLDLSERQIVIGRKSAEALGLSNLELRAQSLESVDVSYGEFDYIICHGVYSWVPPPLQQKILHICKQNLAPHGVAYVSYNTYPGWHLRGAIREMLLYHIRACCEPIARLRKAQAFLEFLARNVDNSQSYGRLILEEANILKNRDAYFFHEHLEDANLPLYFHQFVAHAAEHDLQFLAEVSNTFIPERLQPESRKHLDELAPDFMEREQYLDFVFNRTFRRSLLCHNDRIIDRKPAASAVTRYLIAGENQPTTPNPDLRAGVEVHFVSREGTTMSSNGSVVKAALLTLFEVWPAGLTFEELWSKIRQRLEATLGPGSLPDERERALLQENLFRLFEAGVMQLHTHLPHFAKQVDERPKACPLARLAAETESRIPCRRTWLVDVTPFDRLVLRHLDGRHTREELIPVLIAATIREEALRQQDGSVVRDPALIEAHLRQGLDGFLQRLKRNAVLV